MYLGRGTYCSYTNSEMSKTRSLKSKVFREFYRVTWLFVRSQGIE